MQTSRPAGKRTQVFHLTRNPVSADGSTAAIVEEGRVHLEVSLLIGMRGADIPDTTEIQQEFAGFMLDMALGMRLAGGSLLPGRGQHPQLMSNRGSAQEREQRLRRLRRRLLPGFALVSRQDLLAEHAKQLQGENPQADTLDALLDLTRMNIEPPQANTTSVPASYQPETMVCSYMGMKVLAVSCITNMATGIQTVKHSHARVLEIANQAGDTLCRWLGAVIQRME